MAGLELSEEELCTDVLWEPTQKDQCGGGWLLVPGRYQGSEPGGAVLVAGCSTELWPHTYLPICGTTVADVSQGISPCAAEGFVFGTQVLVLPATGTAGTGCWCELCWVEQCCRSTDGGRGDTDPRGPGELSTTPLG